MTAKSWSSRSVRFSPHQAVLMLCALSLIFPNLVFAQQLRSPQQGAAKRPLTHQDYDSWRSIQGANISRDGKYIAYALVPQDGDGEIVVLNLKTGVERRVGRGWRPLAPVPDLSDPVMAQNLLNAQMRMIRPLITADSRFVVFLIEPNKAETLKAKREKKRLEEMPKSALGIMDLSSGQVTRIDRVKNFQVPEDGVGYLAYLLESMPEDTRDERSSGGIPGAQNSAAAVAVKSSMVTAKGFPEVKKKSGCRLVLRDLTNGGEQTFTDILEYSLSRDAKSLVYIKSAKKEEAGGVYAVTPGNNAAPLELLTGKGRHLRLTWDEDQKQLAFFSDQNDPDVAAGGPQFKLYYWDRRSAQAAEIVSSRTPNFPPGLLVNEKAPLNFSQDGGHLFLSVALPEPEKGEDPDLAADEKVVVDLWHWKDDFIQPMQKVRAEQDRSRSYRAVYHLKEKRYVQLADETMQSIKPSANGLWAIGTDDRNYRTSVGWESFDGIFDVYLVNTMDGSRKKLLEKHHSDVSLSPGGQYALFCDGKDWNTISTLDGKITNLTKKLGVNFWKEDYDLPNKPPLYGQAGWIKDDKYVLLYDRYDIWQVAPDGSSAKNLTGCVGRREKVEFRYQRLDPRERWIDPAKPLLLRAENKVTMDSGFYRQSLDGGAPVKLMMDAKNFGSLSRAKDADVFMLTAARFDQYPDLLITDSSFKELKKVSNAGRQQDQFLWGTAELIHYQNSDGNPLSGILIKPENFDPTKRYPMIVYVYERLSQTLHHFVMPSPGTSINRTFYASNGYLVLMPDISYVVGYPGQSALKSVMPAIQAVVDQGFVKEDAIGIQGHSWGGYQVAYLVTQTNRFRAAAAGAAVGDMISAYNGIRPDTGLPRQFQYERAQSRIGGSLWEYPMRFVENSPVFYANSVKTPLLMLHNDNDDVIPWSQSIEYYLALRRLDKEVYLFNYNGEYHGLRKRQNQKDYTRRMQEYFDYFLKDAPKPEWMEKGIPFLQRDKENVKYRADSLGLRH